MKIRKRFSRVLETLGAAGVTSGGSDEVSIVDEDRCPFDTFSRTAGSCSTSVVDGMALLMTEEAREGAEKEQRSGRERAGKETGK